MKVSKQLPRIQKQVDLLEAAGFLVKLRHESGLVGRILHGPQFKGRTTVRIIDDDPDAIVGMGYAFCSLNDNYCRVDGTQHAFHRAVNDFYKVVGHTKAKSVLHPVKV